MEYGGYAFYEPIPVCKTAYLFAHGISRSTLERIQAAIKDYKVSAVFGGDRFTDNSRVSDETVRRLMSKFAESLGLDGEMIGSCRIPNTRRGLVCYGWLHWFFHLVGDKIPNKDEIHLEPIDRKEVHNEYTATMAHYFPEEPDVALGYVAFLRIWTHNFPNVKIREYKAVTGKCSCCAKLSDLRRKFKAAHIRQAITDLHALHRITYMSERKTYYQKQILAIMQPDVYMSVILDGMAQSHSALPWLSNQKDFPQRLKMHLQGVIEHGQNFVPLLCLLLLLWLH